MDVGWFHIKRLGNWERSLSLFVEANCKSGVRTLIFQLVSWFGTMHSSHIRKKYEEKIVNVMDKVEVFRDVVDPV